MDPTKFVRAEFGRVVRTLGDHGFFAFLPSAIPREIELDSRTVLLLSEADDAAGRLAGVGRLLPNPHLLASAYLTQEAVASSRIEGTQASLSEVFRAVAGGGSPPSSDVQEVRNYIAALEAGLALLNELPVCLRLTKEIHRILMTDVRGREQHPGEFRTTQNWIGSSGDRPDTAAFVPPPVDHLADCLADWERYANETPPVPVLVQCGLLHYQFETIHPFLDGNGRLGRPTLAGVPKNSLRPWNRPAARVSAMSRPPPKRAPGRRRRQGGRGSRTLSTSGWGWRMPSRPASLSWARI